MSNIELEGSTKTPKVSFVKETGYIEIKGRAIPENAIEFFKPMVDWLEEYSKAPQKKTTVKIQLEYFNTASSKCILDLFKKLETISKAQNDVEISWHYEEDDEDMLEAGEDYKSIIRVPFKMVEIGAE